MGEKLEDRNTNRKALEWFVREKDEWYWERTKNKLKETERKMTVLVLASTAISLLATVIFSQHYKS